MKKLRLTLFLFFCCTYLFAQNPFGVKGIVTDSVANVKLRNATISILNSKDSTLYKFTRAAESGAFNIPAMRPGNFILLLTYPEYADYVFPFKLDEAKPSLDFKTVNMKLKATLLNEVIIKGKATAIKIKGDTTEFNAAAYNIKPNDRVEDLLKQFQGLQIDANGKITAQGKTVEKVLVDGEEFFGDDPTLVTKNLRADMVDKVQLFEKSSDQAAFTGVDDGQKKQTLNIILKEDKKNGYFGKVDVGYGSEDFYSIQGMFNRFKGKEKIAAYGTSSNTGKTGLDWNDAQKYGSSGGLQMSEDGMMFFTSGGDDLDGGGRYWGEGIPKAHSGGLHYETKWNKDKESINTNYKIGSLNIQTNKNTLTQNNLPGNIFSSNSDNVSSSNLFRQKIDATYDIKLDTSSNLKITFDGALKNSDNLANNEAVSRREDNTLLNTSTRLTDNEAKQTAVNFNALYMKKLKKLGRNYSINLSNNYNQNTSNGYLKALNSFFDENGASTRVDKTDQLKDNDIVSNNFATNITYNEPINKFFNLVANYGISINSNKADKKTYDASSPNVYDKLNTEFSNDFEAQQLINQVGAIFNYKKAKTVVSFGTKASFINFNQLELYSNQKFDRSFMNWLPQASYQYKFSAQKSISIRYNGSNTQPSVTQLQPVRTNDDPLNIPEGNPDLKPAYNNRINFNYNSYKVLSGQNFYVNGNFSFINNQIISNNTTSAEGITIYKSVNMFDKTPYNYYAYAGFGRKVKFLADIEAGINFNVNGSTNYNYVNSQLNTTVSQSYGPNISFSKYSEKFQLYASFGPNYDSQEASLQKQFSNKGWGRNGYFSGSVKLPKKISIQAEGNYSYTPKSAAFSSAFEQTIINASLTKAFFKQESLKFTFSANDILDQNRGFRRFASANSITQTSYNNISRYFMFSLIWDFNKMGGSAPTKN
jgi:hypothetical protein